ncbi:MAG TPA: hypothetical protein VF191_15515 [Cyclobacteriaceae bacterium]
MRINILIFWIFSLVLSGLGCYIYQLAAFELFSDGDFMQSLQLSPNADTPMVAMAGAFILSIEGAVVLLVVLIVFLIAALIKKTKIVVGTRDFVPSYRRGNPAGLVVPLLAYAFTAFWIWDLVGTLRVKFFGIAILFNLVVVLITWTYAVWLLRLFEGKVE